MKPKNRVLTAQDNYIKTGSEKDLLELYNTLVGIGLTIQLRTQRTTGEWQDPDAVLDIAGNVTLRLMESRQPVIKTAPSAYMKTALFYKNKPTFHDSLDDGEDVPKEEQESDNYDEYVQGLLSSMSLATGTEEGDLVKATLEAQIDWHLVYRHIEDKDLKREYRKKMNEVKKTAIELRGKNGQSTVSVC